MRSVASARVSSTAYGKAFVLMSGVVPDYGYAQPDALAFLDQLIGDFGLPAMLATQPCQPLGAQPVDPYSAAQYLQPAAWVQVPGFEVGLAAGMFARMSAIVTGPQLCSDRTVSMRRVMTHEVYV